MADYQPKSRVMVLVEKLGKFFAFLLDNKRVQRSSKAVMSVETAAKIVLAIDPRTNTCPGYETTVSYVDKWIKPAFEWTEVKEGRWEWVLKHGTRPKDLDDKDSKRISWRDWLLEQNMRYYDLEEEFFTPKEMERVFQYLHCFLVLTSPFVKPGSATKRIKTEN